MVGVVCVYAIMMGELDCIRVFLRDELVRETSR